MKKQPKFLYPETEVTACVTNVCVYVCVCVASQFKGEVSRDRHKVPGHGTGPFTPDTSPRP